MTQISEEELNNSIIRESAAAWFELFARIDTKEDNFIDAPSANFLQLKIGGKRCEINKRRCYNHTHLTFLLQ